MRPLAALLCGLALAPAAWAAGNLSAVGRLTPDPVGLGELATLTLEVSSSGFSGLQATPTFELDNLEIAGGPFQSQSQRWVNGETSSSLQLTWRLRPRAEGPARVRAIRLVTRDATLEVADREIQVVSEAPPGRRRAPQPRTYDPFDDFLERTSPSRRSAGRAEDRPQIFLRAELTPASVVAGQQTTYTLWLYTQADIGAFQPTRLPDFKGFWVREVPQPEPLRPEWITEKGERLGRVPMLRRALYPLSPGRFRLEPTEVDLVVRLADIGPFGSPFGRSETLHLRTEPVELEVRALPSPPPGFAGLVGEVAVSAKLDRSRLEVGEAATLTLRAVSRGHLQSLATPELRLPDGLKTFPPQQRADERLEGSGLLATREWNFVLVPTHPGMFALPPIEMTYFDPLAQSFRQATTESLPLEVVGPAAAAPPVGLQATDRPPTPDDPATTGRSSAPGWVWLAGIGGLALFGGGAIAWRRIAHPAPVRAANAALHSAIAAAAEAAGPAAPREAAGRLEEAWRRHLAERWQLPPSTPVAQWAERLAERRVERALAVELVELAHELHYLRYAPELADPDALLSDAVARSRRLARALR